MKVSTSDTGDGISSSAGVRTLVLWFRFPWPRIHGRDAGQKIKAEAPGPDSELRLAFHIFSVCLVLTVW